MTLNYETYHTFKDTKLADYRFTMELDDESGILGFDSIGNSYIGDDFIQMKKKELIVLERPIMHIYFVEGTLLGRISKNIDQTYIAGPLYFAGEYFSVSGFIDEFFAVRFLVQSLRTKYSDTRISIPLLGNHENEIDHMEEVLSKGSKLPLGFIRTYKDQSWIAMSPYTPKDSYFSEVLGFANQFYAKNFLLQMASLYSPDEFSEILDDIWQIKI
ncbi:MAG: hypothetical protein HC921_19845 [Synechococcaceae cyanobacterium SM2_3_1]|nr:hypothetical protein [Synechococcaceae cyanobacterium SM2_3_1]